MTIKECIDIVDNQKPNQYSTREKVMWLSFIDEIIINEVLKTHEGYDGKYDDFAGYTEEKLSIPLIVKSPYDRLYPAYLKMKIDSENGETARYNNSAALYNSYYMEFRKYYNKTHIPLDVTKNKPIPQKNNAGAISDAMVESIKRELYYLLSEDFAQMTSKDKLYDIVNEYVVNNVQMLKGKDGKDGVDGKDGKDGANGESYSKTELQKIVRDMLSQANKISTVTLPANQWQGTESPYSQVVNIAGATENSKIDINPTIEQLNIFKEKDITFVVANSKGIITVYCIGQKPANDYTIQVSITEVKVI
jgi:hypothetical protein